MANEEINREAMRRLEERCLRMQQTLTDLERNLTERRAAESKLRESEQRLRLITQAANVGLWDWDLQTNAVWFSPEWKRQAGHADDEINDSFEEWRQRIHPEDVSGFLTTLELFRQNPWPNFELEYRIRHKDGSYRWMLAQASLVTGAAGNPVRMMGLQLDVTERRRMEAALRENQRTLATLITNLPGAAYRCRNDANWTAEFVSEGIFGLTGYIAAEFLEQRRHFSSLILSDDRARVWNDVQEALRERRPYQLTYRIRTAGKQIKWLWGQGSGVYDAEGKLVALEGFITDITERKRAEEQLAERERQLFTLMSNLPGMAYRCANDPNWTMLFVSEGCLALTGYSSSDLLNNAKISFNDLIHPEDRERVWTSAQQCLSERRRYQLQYRLITATGETKWVWEQGQGIFSSDGELLFLEGFIADVTERKQAEETLRESEERFRELTETIEDVFWIADPDKTRLFYVSPAYEKVWGRSCQSVYEKPDSWTDPIHPDDRDRVLKAIAAERASGVYDQEYRIVRPDGAVRVIRDRAFPVRSEAGDIERLVGVARDITDRRQLEEQLRQSQKLEAIGQLAGGVAHDFNNILAAMLMQVELTTRMTELPGEVREGLQQIRAAAERAANLTRQLLLFSRRQVMQTLNVDVNEIVTALAKMLQRIIGEDVRLQLSLHPGALMTRADPGMLDQVLLNLSVNARDAMPGGGRLSIETGLESVTETVSKQYPDAAPGRYVWIKVSDTGCGIGPEILPRIFEPFFTTKEPGKGTGLGLATVFGIVKQHHGWIKVETEPGRGSTFQVYLPAAAGERTADAGSVAARIPVGGTETILVAEDEPAVRALTQAVLEQSGYRVFAAADGPESVRLWQEHRSEIALLITDLVMPGGMTGQQLAARLRQDNPDLKVIFTSGYSVDVAGRDLRLGRGEDFVQKPCPPDRLLEVVRRVLDRVPGTR